MVDYLTEIPLPGRTFAARNIGAAAQNVTVALPSFVAGPENRLVANAFSRLLDSAAAVTGASRFAPAAIALFGPSGVGKSHLARGLVRYWQQRRGDDTAAYVTASDFRREFSEAIGRNAVLEFRQRYRGRQLLAIDDLHQLPADNYLQQELRYTLDDCEEAGATVLVTSKRPVPTLGSLTPDVRSRLAGGLTLQLAPPAAAARVRIIRQTSIALGHQLADEAAQRLATGLSGTTADLFSALFELFATSSSSGASDVQRIERLLAYRAARRPTLREIIALVAKQRRLPQKQLKSASRKQSIVAARAMAIYLARELAGASYQQIGRALGGRDHTTIMHNYRKIDRTVLHDPETQETIQELRRLLLCR